jgi:hypothetical protein
MGLGVPPPQMQAGSGFPLQVRTRRSSSLAGFPLQSVTRNPVYPTPAIDLCAQD